MINKAWIIAVDMGYGHQRAAYPLRHLSPDGKVLIANNYAGIPKSDRRLWSSTQSLYEAISRLKNIPIIGDWIFGIMDWIQRIPAFYPHRDLSAPSLQLKAIYRSIQKGWGKHLIEHISHESIPLITTFFSVAFMAEEFKFPGVIYCVICDTDVSRAWVALNSKKSRIKYLVPCHRVAERLKLYGVDDDRIFLTGFPIPEENLDGGHSLDKLKADLSERIINLDPEKRYRHKYGDTIKHYLGDIKLEARHRHPLTLTFAVGGAGAQRALASGILYSLRGKILKNEIRLNLVAGVRNDVYTYFTAKIKEWGLSKAVGKNLNIIFALDKEEYFKIFNATLRITDILWTKPSELVFYSALGLPIIMAPSVGSQEIYNRLWLKTIGAGISQNEPRLTHEWLWDWINSGWLAEAAMAGFLDGRQFGVRNIIDVVFNGMKEPTADDSLL